VTEDSDEAPSDSVSLSIGSDGLIVRSDGEWAEEKLFYIEGYIRIFTTGMKEKWPRRVYIDLFSGPGRSRIRRSNLEIDGSPLRALNARYGFTHLYLNDASSDVIDALRKRAGERPSGGGEVTYSALDCNEAAVVAGDSLFGTREASRTLGLAVVDPTGIQISFDAIRQMTATNRKIDLIITFMTSYIRRFFDQPGFGAKMDLFFGTSDWRKFSDTRARGERVTYGDLLNFYKERLKSIGYLHVNDKVSVANTRSQPIYHMIFASKSERGAEFFEKISRRRFSGQQRMDL
jgi:three-Cys-motif partner protein